MFIITIDLLIILAFCRGESAPNLPVDMRPLPKEPDSDERKKKTLKSKMKVKENKDKPNISYPTNFEHTVHVGFDAVTGEFTVGSPNSRFTQSPLYTYYSKCTRLTLRCCITVRIIYERRWEKENFTLS